MSEIVGIKREKLLWDLISKIRSDIDIKKIKKIAVSGLAKVFSPDRCLILEYDQNQGTLPIEACSEYLASENQKSMVGKNFDEEFDFFNMTNALTQMYNEQKQNVLYIPNASEYIKSSNLMGSKIEKYCTQSDFTTCVGVSIFEENKIRMFFTVKFAQERHLCPEDVEFIRVYAEQIYIAIKQSNIISQFKISFKKNKIFQKILNITIKSLDVDKITSTFVQEMAKNLEVYRAAFCKFVPEQNTFLIPNEKNQYLSSLAALSYKEMGEHLGNAYPFLVEKMIEDKQIIFLRNREEFIKKNNLEGTKDADFLRKHKIYSGLLVPVTYKNKLFGLYLFSYSKIKDFAQDDIDFIVMVSKQTSIAIYQAELFEQNKKRSIEQKKLYNEIKLTAEREKLLRNVVSAMTRLFDAKEIIKHITRVLGKEFHLDRCFVVEYDKDANNFKDIQEGVEYRSSNKVKSLIGYKYSQRSVDLYINNPENFLSREKFITSFEGAQRKEIERYLEKFNVLEGFYVSIIYREEIFGFLVGHFCNEGNFLREEDIDTIKIFAKNVGIALYQSRLFDKEKKARKKEKVLNDIVFSIRQNIELNEMKRAIATEIARYIDAERVIIHLIDQKTGRYNVVDEYSEYCTISNCLSYEGINVENRKFAWSKDLLHSGQEILMPDFYAEVEKYIKISPTVRKWLHKLGIRSEYIFPIKYQDAHLANLYIIQESGKKTLSDEELEDIRYLTVQIAFALNQSITYQDLQSKIKQELLLRKVTETIRGSLDIKEIKQRIVDELGKTLGADRCYLRSFNIEEELFLAPDTEYLASEDIMSLKGVEPDQEGLRYFFDQVKTQDGIYPVEVTKDFIIEHNLENKSLDRYFKQVNIKSDFAMPVWSKKGQLTFLVLHYIKESFFLTDELRELLVMLSRQISLALEQSDLYNDLKIQAERERASRKVIEVIRSSLDLDKILDTVANEILALFAVQRVFLGKINFTDKKNYVEVTSERSIRSFSNLENEKFEIVADFWQKYLKKYNNIKIIDNMSESDLPENIKEIYIYIGVKSLICLPIKTKEELWGGIFLSCTKNYKKWTPDEVSFLEGIVSQIDTAIRQAELYGFQKKIAHKESILRNLISEIKLTRDLNQAYGKLLESLAKVFGLNRVLFLESSSIVPEELYTKYEFIKDRSGLSVNNLIFPSVCMDKFFELIHKLKPLVIDDVMLCHPEKTLDFFGKNKISSMMAFPLVKYSKEVKVLGFIVLCSDNKRKWSEVEIELMNVISESVVSVIWEISKFIEIEDLRNSFVLTLAHDFQVPLIGEKLAIEFLLEKATNENSSDREILEEILANNTNIIALLNKSVDIYNYDAGKKPLTMDVFEVSDILNKALFLAKESAKKEVKFDFAYSEQKMFIKVDKKEILKVLDTLLENAIEHTLSSDAVRVSYFSKDNRVIISVHNKGAAIPLETQEIIFKRYEMALAIERKIGAGTGLFLAKKIVEAHKGHIWFETSNEKGTTFYVSLPQIRLKHI